VTILVRDPSLAEPADVETCVAGGYFCISHRRPYRHESCGDGAHEIRWECIVHGPEWYGIDQKMIWDPTGFDPPLTIEQLGNSARRRDRDVPFSLATFLATEDADWSYGDGGRRLRKQLLG
jgi:hypothetical protein